MSANFNARPWLEYKADVLALTRAAEVHPFRSKATGRPLNAFCWYEDAATGALVARYHDTDILTVAPDGSVRVTFGGWHTPTTRSRFGNAAERFGIPLRACAARAAGVSYLMSPGCRGWRGYFLEDRSVLTISREVIEALCAGRNPEEG